MNPITAVEPRIALRPVEDGDEAFLLAVYASTRSAELAITGWTQAQKDAFLRMQFHAQRQYYTSNYLGAEYLVILLAGRSIGRLSVHRDASEILIMDIALLPDYRNAGVGTEIIRDLQEQARTSGSKVRLHVETTNPALNLYKRLGFRITAEFDFYYEMVWQPDAMSHE